MRGKMAVISSEGEACLFSVQVTGSLAQGVCR